MLLGEEYDKVKQNYPAKSQLDNLKNWMKEQGKWIRALEETFQYQKSHIQFVSKWLHESYKVKKYNNINE